MDWVPWHTHHNELAAGGKTGHKWPHSTATGGCCENRSGPAHTLQHRCGIIDGSIDVDLRAQVFRKLFLVASLPDGDSAESHVPRKLDAKMPKATNALHRDQISAAQASVAKSVVGCNTRAEEWGGLYGCELIRNGSDAVRFSNHHFRISSIHGYSRYDGVLTLHHISASARFAHSVFTAEEADTDPLTDFPFGHSAAQCLNMANDFMPRNARQLQSRVYARDRGCIGVTNSTCLYPNPNLTCSRLGHLPFRYSKRARCGDFHCFVCAFHLYVPLIRISFWLNDKRLAAIEELGHMTGDILDR